MKSRCTGLVVFLLSLVMVVPTAAAAEDQAQSVAAPNGLTTLTIGVPIKVSFNGPEDNSFPMNVGWVLYDAKECCAILYANFYPMNTNKTLPWVGGDDRAKAFTKSGDGRDGTRQFQVRMPDSFFVGAGDSIVLEAWMETSSGKFSFPTMNIALERTPSVLTAKYSRENVLIAAKAQTARGLVPAEGKTRVRYRLPGSKKWKAISQESPMDELRPDGTDSVPTGRPLPRGSIVEVSLMDCGWCTNVTNTFKVK